MSEKESLSGSHQSLEEMIGRNLKAYRLDQNLNQSELAERAGVSRRTITSIENGQGSTLGTLIRLVRALGKSHLLSPLLDAPPPSPIKLHEANQLLQNTRKRASKPRSSNTEKDSWSWGDQ